MTDTLSIPFLDLHAGYAELQPELDAAYARVMDSGWYVGGPEVETFEARLRRFLRHRRGRRCGQRAGRARAHPARVGHRAR